MPHSSGTESDYYQYQRGPARLYAAISLKVRRKMFARLLTTLQPGPATRILDVGFTADGRSDSNFFERMYAHPEMITIVSNENFNITGTAFADLRCLKADGMALPFPDNAFDLATSFATLEHVGSRAAQKAFIRELSRVGRQVCLTIPNRWYPLEFHTLLPLVHWLPPRLFRLCCRWLGKGFYAREETLNPLGKKDVLAMLPDGARPGVWRFWLFGCISNYMFIFRT